MLNNPTPYIYPCLYQKSLSLTISISKLAYASGFYWPRALASCSGSVLWHLTLAPCSGYRFGWALTWTPRGVVTLWWIG